MKKILSNNSANSLNAYVLYSTIKHIMLTALVGEHTFLLSLYITIALHFGRKIRFPSTYNITRLIIYVLRFTPK